MIHKMSLFAEPFESMKAGKKIFEVRLNDEKRRKLKIQDTIEFIRLPDHDETLTIEVQELRQYHTFREMYEEIPAKDFDAVGDTIDEMIESTYNIYTPEQENKWGTLAIKVKIIK